MIALGIFFVALTASSATTGLFVYRALAEQGFATSYDASLYLTLAAACFFTASQLLYVTVVAFVKPSRGNMFWAMESLSQVAAVILIPYLRGTEIPLPHPALEQVEPLLYLGAFAITHTGLKLVSFFAALQSEPTSRVWGFAWGTGLLIALGIGNHAMHAWLNLLEQSRPQAHEQQRVYEVDHQFAVARAVRENTAVVFEAKPTRGRVLTVRWAFPPDARDAPPKYVHVYATLRGTTSRTLYVPLRLRAQGWTELHLPAEEMGDDTSTVSIRWRGDKEPFWQTKLGLSPGVSHEAALLMSGPWWHAAPEETGPPNVILIGVDGLGTGWLSRFGNRDISTRSLDQFSQSAVTFGNAFASSPEAAGSYMTLFTSVTPLEHGFLGKHRGPLPDQFSTLFETFQKQNYATAFFTEGTARGDLLYGGGWERGVEIFDVSYEKSELSQSSTETEHGDEDQPETSAPRIGSVATLDKARDWIERHKECRFAVFIRVGELAELTYYDRYDQGRSNVAVPVTQRDVFQRALVYLDRNLGAFFKELHDLDVLNRCAVVVLAPFGVAIPRSGRLGEQVEELSEDTLRVPVLFRAPTLTPVLRDDIISLADVGHALSSIAGATFNPSERSANFLKGPIHTLAISVSGDPLILSVRGPKWRLMWDTGKRAFSDVSTSTPQPPRLYDVARLIRSGYAVDESARNMETVTRYKTLLENLLEEHDRLWRVSADTRGVLK